MLLNSFFKEARKSRVMLLMSLPSLVFFLIFAYIPMLGVVIAFKDYNYGLGIFKSPWIGLDNFRFFFLSGKAVSVTVNTFLYNLAFIILNNTLEIVFAIFLSEMIGKYFKKITQSMMFLPYFMSWATIGALFYGIFNYEHGYFNRFLQVIGLQPIDIYSVLPAWKYIIVGVSAWQMVGYGVVLYLAAITSIDISICEAAEMDGANIFQRIWHITLPSISPTIVIMILLAIGNIFRGNFQMFWQLVGNNGSLHDTTDVIDTFVFRSLLFSQDHGMAASAGFYQSILCFVTIMAANYLVKKYDPDYALF